MALTRLQEEVLQVLEDEESAIDPGQIASRLEAFEAPSVQEIVTTLTALRQDRLAEEVTPGRWRATETNLPTSHRTPSSPTFEDLVPSTEEDQAMTQELSTTPGFHLPEEGPRLGN